MRAEPDVDALLLQLFDVAASPAWTEWLENARRYFGAISAALSPLGPVGAGWMTGVQAGVGSDRIHAYREHFHRVDKWMQRIRATEPGQPHSLAMLVPDRELFASEIYNDFMRPGARRFGLGVTVETGASRFILNFGRTTGEGDFETEHLAALARIAKFLPKALATQRILHTAEANSDASQAVMNQSRRGTLLLDSSFGIVFANRAGAELVESEEFLGVRRGQLVALSRGDDRRMREALEGAAARAGHHAILMLGSTRSDAHLAASIIGMSDNVAPVLDLGVARPTIMVELANHAEQAEIPPEHLVTAFGFTSQEARTASLLAAGLGLPEVADRLSISRETVRYHLKGLFAKSGAHSQRELVHFVTTSLPPIAAASRLRVAS